MKYMLFTLVFFSVTAHANPFMSVKERLRIHLWTEGIEEKPVSKERPVKRQLPEELERALRKN